MSQNSSIDSQNGNAIHSKYVEKADKQNWFASLTRKRKSKNAKHITVPDDNMNTNELDTNHLQRQSHSRQPDDIIDGDKSSNFFKRISRRLQNKLLPSRSHLSRNVQNDRLNGNFPARAMLHVTSFQSSAVTTREDTPTEFSMVREIDDEGNCYMYVNMDNDYQEYIAMISATNQLKKFGWYWGALSRNAAQKLMQGKPNGSFLIRNSQMSGCHFSISFRSVGITLHYRIEYVDGFWIFESAKNESIVDLIKDTMERSEDDVFCYARSSTQAYNPFLPVRLTNPISKFGILPSLQNLSGVVIRNLVTDDNIQHLPLPNKLQQYVKNAVPYL